MNDPLCFSSVLKIYVSYRDQRLLKSAQPHPFWLQITAPRSRFVYVSPLSYYAEAYEVCIRQSIVFVLFSFLFLLLLLLRLLLLTLTCDFYISRTKGPLGLTLCT